TLDTLLDKVAVAIHSEQRLTSELAHELRTPLTSVQGTADLMAMRADLGPELGEDVEAIRAGSRRMAETITALLELARSSANVVAAGSCDLREVLDDVLADLGERRSVVVLDVPTGVRLGLPRALARRAVGPVVDNAVRLADAVQLSLLDHGRPGHITLAVDDDGAGIDADIRDRIFEPGETTGSGSGLGLPLARRIARSAGGDVRLVAHARDRETVTRFVVELPRG
ncbi:MAG: HAMP domain-containing histidine kinase, partial [Pseudorhodobacter sp.]|nr:HAMP domain-containing histidine kinase [Frankiaceae bacterium]